MLNIKVKGLRSGPSPLTIFRIISMSSRLIVLVAIAVTKNTTMKTNTPTTSVIGALKGSQDMTKYVSIAVTDEETRIFADDFQSSDT